MQVKVIIKYNPKENRWEAFRTDTTPNRLVAYCVEDPESIVDLLTKVSGQYISEFEIIPRDETE